MGFDSAPRINEIVAFLQAHAPSEYARFVSDPAFSEFMELGTEGGEPEPTSIQGLRTRSRILGDALSSAIIKCASALKVTQSRLARARKLRFSSLSLGAVGASSVIGTAFYAPTATVIAGALTLLSNIVGAFADQIVLGQNMNEADVSGIIQRLIKAQGRAELTASMLETINIKRASADELSTLLREGNSLFEEILDALAMAAK